MSRSRLPGLVAMTLRLVLLVLLFLAAPARAADTYSLAWSSLDGGGSSSGGGGALVLAGATVGQPDASAGSAAAGAALAFHGGVWPAMFSSDPTIIAADNFAYADGPASDVNGGTGAWTARWIGFGFRVRDESIDGASTMPVNFNRLRRMFTNAEASPELYMAFDLTTPQVIGTNDFAVATLYTIEFSNPPSLVLGKAQGSSEFVLGNSHASSGVVLQPLTTYHLVGACDIDQRQWSLWVNPDANDRYDPATGRGTADATYTWPGAFPAAYQVALDTSKPGYVIDNLVISHAPSGVGLASGPVTVPTPDALAPEIRIDNDFIVLSWKDLGVPVVVEESPDLLNWSPIVPQPAANTYRVPVVPGGRYLRLSLGPR